MAPRLGLLFPGDCPYGGHPGCRLAGSPGLVHAALDRAGSGTLQPGQPDWTVSLDCCVIFIPTNLLLLPVYTTRRSNKMYLRPEQTRDILQRGIKGMTSWNLSSPPGSEALPLKTPILLLLPVNVRLLDIKQMSNVLTLGAGRGEGASVGWYMRC